jgi:RNA polymerase sigma-70 factor, ECF subfamily
VPDIGAAIRDVDVTQSGYVSDGRRCCSAGVGVGLQPFGRYRVLPLNELIFVPTSNTEPARSAEFTTFMRAYQDMVYSTAVRLLGDDAQAEDIAQEVFVRAYAHFEQLRSSPTSGGWLKTVTTNLALNHLHRYRRRFRLFSEDSELDPEPQLPVADTLLAEMATEQHRALIENALRTLPPDQRAALVLYHFEDFSYQEISARLGASLTKIKTDIRRARLALLPMLQARGVGQDSLTE